MKVTKKQFVTGTIWKIMENFGTRGVSFAVSLVLTRILLPAEYSIIALTAIFVALSDILIQGGFGTALIQKKNVDDVDYSTILYLSLSVSLVLYTAIFFAAPAVSIFYETPLLCPVLRVQALVLFIQAFSSIRSAMLIRGMKFKVLFTSTLASNILSGAIGITVAKLGFGVWALVAQQLLQQIFLTAILFIRLKWKPKLVFSKERVKSLLPFSLKVLGSSLLSYAGDSIFSAVIGKSYSKASLGYTEKGGQLPRELSLYTFGAVSNTLLPMLSSYQDDVGKVKGIIRKVVSFCSFIIFPMMAWLCLVSSPLIVFLFTEKWLPGVPVMQWACLYYAATPLMLINVQVFFAMGKSGIRMRTEMVNLFMMVTALVLIAFVFKGSIYTLAAARAFIAVILMMITSYEVYKLIGYRLREMLEDVWKPMLATVLMGAAVYVAGLPEMAVFPRLMVQTTTAGASYLLLSVLLKIPGLKEIAVIGKSLIGRKNKTDAED